MPLTSRYCAQQLLSHWWTDDLQFGSAGVGHFRVCFARDEAQWEEALGRMVTVLDALGQKRGVA